MLHGYNPPSRFLSYLSWTEIAALPDRENTVIVLLAGSTAITPDRKMKSPTRRYAA